MSYIINGTPVDELEYAPNIKGSEKIVIGGRGLYALSPDMIRDYILHHFAKDSINLGNVDNTSDKDKPLSKDMTAALKTKLGKDDPHVVSVNLKTGVVTLTKSDIGLGNVDNTSDKDKPLSILSLQALDTKLNIESFNTFKSEVNSFIGVALTKPMLGESVASLDINKKIPVAQIPTLGASTVALAAKAKEFDVPVTLNLKGAVTGSGLISGSTPSIDINTTLKPSGAVSGNYAESLKVSVDTTGIITGISATPFPKATTSTSGLVQLSSSTTSPEEAVGANSKAVKIVYDLAKEIELGSIRVSTLGKPNGVASLDATGKVPASQIPESGGLVAESLSNLRNIQIKGDGSWNVQFNGSKDVEGTLNLSTVLSTPGSYGSGTTIPVLKVDAKGRVIGATSVNITPLFKDITSKPTTLQGYGITDALTTKNVEDLINARMKTLVPPGTIIAYASPTPPSGYLALNNAKYKKTTYPELYAVLGDRFKTTAAADEFNVPEGRAEFLRGFDAGRGIDPGRLFGSHQIDTFKKHSHKVKEGHRLPQWPGGDMLASGDDYTQGIAYKSTTDETGDNETRPRNLSVLFCIKT